MVQSEGWAPWWGRGPELHYDPLDMTEPTVKSQVMSGFRLAIKALFFVAVALSFFGGAVGVYLPAGRRSIGAWLLLVLSALVILATQDLWVKALPGILKYATLAGIVAVIGGPSMHPSFTRIGALVFTVYFAVCAAASLGLEKRRLGPLDRAALAVFVLSVAWLMARDAAKLDSGAKTAPLDFGSCVAMTTGAGSLVLAWARYLFRHHHRHRHTALRDQAVGGGA